MPKQPTSPYTSQAGTRKIHISHDRRITAADIIPEKFDRTDSVWVQRGKGSFDQAILPVVQELRDNDPYDSQTSSDYSDNEEQIRHDGLSAIEEGTDEDEPQSNLEGKKPLGRPGKDSNVSETRSRGKSKSDKITSAHPSDASLEERLTNNNGSIASRSDQLMQEELSLQEAPRAPPKRLRRIEGRNSLDASLVADQWSLRRGSKTEAPGGSVKERAASFASLSSVIPSSAESTERPARPLRSSTSRSSIQPLIEFWDSHQNATERTSDEGSARLPADISKIGMSQPNIVLGCENQKAPSSSSSESSESLKLSDLTEIFEAEEVDATKPSSDVAEVTRGCSTNKAAKTDDKSQPLHRPSIMCTTDRPLESPKPSRRQLFVRKVRNVALPMALLKILLGRQLAERTKPGLEILARGEPLKPLKTVRDNFLWNPVSEIILSPGRIVHIRIPMWFTPFW
ncbi:hypothetical protein L228DRAFT_264356 [Xylona heveae TC161]|uniref:Uncharacterized protein n=1 Tax=Xylona heveae (strain CBS 132557 / TC161) TaxID=1328760 RepID=A0A165J955_XYLHT|nr:hypothetical protein L228DRAFT_264356 [Xylona heveae TC161]KZF25919.1 hypothetical protein L228DRAFT_264356 [Xylona heveae TC161]